MTDKWGPTGVAKTGPGLGADRREQLALVVRSGVGSDRKVEPFLNEVDSAVGIYRGMDLVREKSLPAIVRSELQQAHSAATRLGKQIAALDQYSRSLVASAEEQKGQGELLTHVNAILATLAEARRRADELPKSGGRLPDHPRIIMAAHIGYAMRKHLGVEPTTTREGIFEEILTVVLQGLGEKVTTVHDLAVRARKVRVNVSPDGVIEFDPQVG